MLDPGERHIGLRLAVIYDCTGADIARIVAQVVENAGKAVYDQRVVGSWVAAIDGDGARQAGRIRRVLVMEVDRVVARQTVDHQVGLVVELECLKVVNRHESGVNGKAST